MKKRTRYRSWDLQAGEPTKEHAVSQGLRRRKKMEKLMYKLKYTKAQIND